MILKDFERSEESLGHLGLFGIFASFWMHCDGAARAGAEKNFGCLISMPGLVSVFCSLALRV